MILRCMLRCLDYRLHTVSKQSHGNTVAEAQTSNIKIMVEYTPWHSSNPGI